jgi:hypothetical protein
MQQKFWGSQAQRASSGWRRGKIEQRLDINVAATVLSKGSGLPPSHTVR